jgi:hypothetical protein
MRLMERYEDTRARGEMVEKVLVAERRDSSVQSEMTHHAYAC